MPLPWMRLLLLAQLGLLLKRHLERLEVGERAELRRIVAKSRGRPSRNLSQRERDELRRLVDKLELVELGRSAAGRVTSHRLRRH
jgi:hypothetical protein